MHPRTVGRPPRRTPVDSSSAFHRTEPPGCERHRRAAREDERAGANESNALQRPHHAAFTLIELLVVIAIIAILIGLLFPAFKAVQNQARQAQAKNDLTQIVNAVNAFYTEYGKYPIPGTAEMTIYQVGGHQLQRVLFSELCADAHCGDVVMSKANCGQHTANRLHLRHPT